MKQKQRAKVYTFLFASDVCFSFMNKFLKSNQTVILQRYEPQQIFKEMSLLSRPG